jgi:uncharacterized metal-binding protein
MLDCTNCKKCSCYQGEDCVQEIEAKDIIEKSKDEYKKEDNLNMLKVSSEIEAEFYMKLPRVSEVVEFINRIGYKKIGIAHCVGLVNEAHILKAIFEKKLEKIEVEALCCKFSGINKEDYSLHQIKPDRYEAICNPIGQALMFNKLKTDLNIILGLCIGHDILFTKYSQAPVTTLIVKDRVTGHNPAVALYSSYHNR